LPHPAPIPEPYDELVATIVECQIVRLSIAETLLSIADPVPIPEPSDDLDAWTIEREIVNELIDDLPSSPCPCPVPMLEMISESQIMMFTISEQPPSEPRLVPIPTPTPIPEPSAEFVVTTVEFQILTFATLETPPFKPFPLPIPESDDTNPSLREFITVMFSIFTVRPFASPLPIPVRPTAETDEFRN
jgi:hypothetical protein